jgi:nucleoid-associated protein YgaU
MGLFDFVSDIGNKLFGDDEQEGATLKGDAKDQAAAEKAILMAGNVRGVREVNADQLNAPPATEAEQHVSFYEIQKGDTLWAIAKSHYGDGNRYDQIFEANREVIKDPDLIFPGQKIRIPPA